MRLARSRTVAPGCRANHAVPDREVQFVDDAGKVLVSALNRWAMLDRVTMRPARVTAEIAAPFLSN